MDREQTFTVVVADPASFSKNILSKIWCWEASKLLWAATSTPLTRKETSLGRRELGKRKWERSPAIFESCFECWSNNYLQGNTGLARLEIQNIIALNEHSLKSGRYQELELVKPEDRDNSLHSFS